MTISQKENYLTFIITSNLSLHSRLGKKNTFFLLVKVSWYFYDANKSLLGVPRDEVSLQWDGKLPGRD